VDLSTGNDGCGQPGKDQNKRAKHLCSVLNHSCHLGKESKLYPRQFGQRLKIAWMLAQIAQPTGIWTLILHCDSGFGTIAL